MPAKATTGSTNTELFGIKVRASMAGSLVEKSGTEGDVAY